MPPPTDIATLYLGENSFIELLFNEDFSGSEYKYKYKEETFGSWPSVVVRRITIYPSPKYLAQDDVLGENIFSLTSEEFSLLDSLLAYRMDATSLTIIDTSETYFDSTATILYCSYNNLSSSLSKLIYLYLDLKINGNTDKYDNVNLISSGGLLTSCYEAYVIDKYFAEVSARHPDLQPTA